MSSAPIFAYARLLWALGLALLFCGCTGVAFKAPVGTPMSASEMADLKGEWIANDDEDGAHTVRVEQKPGSDRLIAKWSEEGKDKHADLCVTKIGEHVQLVWVDDEDEAVGLLFPFRICRYSKDAVAFLSPDDEEVKKLANAGKLVAGLDKKNNNWIVSKGDLEALLESKEFWQLGGCFILTRSTAVSGAGPNVKP
jgi:hypothetical protein